MSEEPKKNISTRRSRLEGWFFAVFAIASFVTGVALLAFKKYPTGWLCLGSSVLLFGMFLQLMRYSFWSGSQYSLQGDILTATLSNGTEVTLDVRSVKKSVRGLLGETYDRTTGGYALVKLEAEGKSVWMTGEQYQALFGEWKN